MNVATFAYEQYLSSTGVRRMFWAGVRRVLIRLLNDPSCQLQIHGRLLQVPLSHSLPVYLKHYPHYDRLPGRLSDYLHRQRGHIRCIDVGANIGDSIAAFCKDDNDTFLAIEPDSHFHEFLVANWRGNRNVRPLAIVCSASSSEEVYAVAEQHGTASFRPAAHGIRLLRRPLDAIVNDYPEFRTVDILKIDTDGHDFDVIAGADQLISSCQPAVLFECEAFEDSHYVENCLSTLRRFRDDGYRQFLLYDNYGHLMGKYSLLDLAAFRNLLFFQLTSSFHYFDILLMKDSDIAGFYGTEVRYFTETMPNRSMQQTAAAAVEP